MVTARIGFNTAAKSSTSELPNAHQADGKKRRRLMGDFIPRNNKMIYATIILILIFLIVSISSAADIETT